LRQEESSGLLSSEQVREASLFMGSFKEETCKKCKYVASLAGYHVLECSKCRGKYHQECLDEYSRNIGHSEQAWRCPDCIRCTNCLSTKQSEQ